MWIIDIEEGAACKASNAGSKEYGSAGIRGKNAGTAGNIPVYLAGAVAMFTIYEVNGLTAIFSLPVVLISLAIVIRFKRKSAERSAERMDYLHLHSSLSSISVSQSRGAGNASSVMREMKKHSNDGRLAFSSLSRIYSMITFRSTFPGGLKNSTGYGKGYGGKNTNTKEKEKEAKITDGIIEELRDKGEFSGSLDVSIRLLENEVLSKRETEYGSLNRYLMTSTVLCGILPSLATLAFVGYSIIYFSQLTVLLYFTVILGIMPFLYWASKIKVNEVYEPDLQ
jgi:hypothetical protein